MAIRTRATPSASPPRSDAELADNAIWSAAHVDDPFLRRQILAADWTNLEQPAENPGGLSER